LPPETLPGGFHAPDRAVTRYPIDSGDELPAAVAPAISSQAAALAKQLNPYTLEAA